MSYILSELYIDKIMFLYWISRECRNEELDTSQFMEYGNTKFSV